MLSDAQTSLKCTIEGPSPPRKKKKANKRCGATKRTRGKKNLEVVIRGRRPQKERESGRDESQLPVNRGRRRRRERTAEVVHPPGNERIFPDFRISSAKRELLRQSRIHVGVLPTPRVNGVKVPAKPQPKREGEEKKSEEWCEEVFFQCNAILTFQPSQVFTLLLPFCS